MEYTNISLRAAAVVDVCIKSGGAIREECYDLEIEVGHGCTDSGFCCCALDDGESVRLYIFHAKRQVKRGRGHTLGVQRFSVHFRFFQTLFP